MPKFRRLQNWPSLMDDWLREHAKADFAWGKWDCALMAASHIDNIAGSEFYAAHAGKYHDSESAADYLKTLGVPDVGALPAAMICGGFNPRMAQRGDIVTFNTALGPGLGIVDLSGMKIAALSPSETGFIRLPLRLAVAAWRV